MHRTDPRVVRETYGTAGRARAMVATRAPHGRAYCGRTRAAPARR